MINKGQWVILPAKAVLYLPGLGLSPPGVVPQCGHRPRWICDYSRWGVNKDTLPLAVMEAMQLGWSLEQILLEILFANPSHGLVHMIKLDISDGFYQIDLNIDDIPKLGVVFPTLPGDKPLIAFPLVLPIGWTDSPPKSCLLLRPLLILPMPDCLQGGCRRPISWMTWLPLFLPRLTRLTGDPSQSSCLSLSLLMTPLFQWLGPLPLMWMSLWMTSWVWLRNTSSKYIVPFWKLLMRSFAPYLLQTLLDDESLSQLRSYWKGMALGVPSSWS